MILKDLMSEGDQNNGLHERDKMSVLSALLNPYRQEFWRMGRSLNSEWASLFLSIARCSLSVPCSRSTMRNTLDFGQQCVNEPNWAHLNWLYFHFSRASSSNWVVAAVHTFALLHAKYTLKSERRTSQDTRTETKEALEPDKQQATLFRVPHRYWCWCCSPGLACKSIRIPFFIRVLESEPLTTAQQPTNQPQHQFSVGVRLLWVWRKLCHGIYFSWILNMACLCMPSRLTITINLPWGFVQIHVFWSPNVGTRV